MENEIEYKMADFSAMGIFTLCGCVTVFFPVFIAENLYASVAYGGSLHPIPMMVFENISLIYPVCVLVFFAGLGIMFMRSMRR